MTCRDIRELGDSFLCEELLTETNHEILRHLEACPSCRTDIEARRRLRGALRVAFHAAPDLAPSPGFAHRLQERLRETDVRERRSWVPRRRWIAVAAGVMLAVGLTGALFLKRPFPNRTVLAANVLAQDAMGDHRNCALKFRLVRAPIPLEDAAERFDRSYRLLLSAPPDDTSTPGGAVHVVERHSCAYGARRFGHVIMRYRGRVVSLLMTTDDGVTRSADTADTIPHLIGQPMNGLSVVAVNGPRHAILLVSDLDSGDLAELSRAVSMPLVRRLEASAPHAAVLTALARSLGVRSPLGMRVGLDLVAFSNVSFSGHTGVQAQPALEAADDASKHVAVLLDGVGIVGRHNTTSPQVSQTNRGIR
jgi:hypothetical protein